MISIFQNLEHSPEVNLSPLNYMTKKLKIYRRLLFLFAFAVLFILSKIVFAQSDKPVASVASTFDELQKWIGLITSIGFVAGIIIAVIYWFWKGKDSSKLEADLKAADARNARLQAELSDSTAKFTKSIAIINHFRRARRIDRKIIYRLAAKKENIDIDIDEDIHESDISELDIDSNLDFLEALK